MKPCGSCPWRRGNTPQQIPAFNMDKAEGLIDCAAPDDRWGLVDGFRQVMACHLSTEDANVPCAGYLASPEGIANLNVRLHLPREWAEAQADCKGLDLHQRYGDVLAALREAWT